MSKKRNSRVSQPKTDWDQLDALTDEDVRSGIDADEDAQATDEEFWNKAKLVVRVNRPEPSR